MEEIFNNLLKHQSYFNQMKRRATEVTKSLKETFDWYAGLDVNRVPVINDKKFGSNIVFFTFCGIAIYIELKYNLNEGIIIWGSIKQENSVEIKSELYRCKFDKFGNIVEPTTNDSLGMTSDFGYAFIPQLNTIVTKYFEIEKEANLA